MKHFNLQIFNVLTLSLISIISFAQGPARIVPMQSDKYALLDSAKYKFTYALTFATDSTKLNSTLKNHLILLIGNNESKFFSEDEKTKKTKQTTHSDGYLLTEGRGLAGTEIFKNLKNRKITVTTRLFATKDVYIYEEENAPNIKWKITGESIVILSYTCKKATATFLGRQYEAWFTTEIPINSGPWKLDGLPGLIIKANDIQKHFNFECIGIEFLNTKIPIVKYNWKYVSTTRKNVNKLIKNMHQNPLQTFTSMGLNVVSMPENFKYPYNPLERE